MQKIKVIHSFKKCDMTKLLEDLQEAPWGNMNTFDSMDD